MQRSYEKRITRDAQILRHMRVSKKMSLSSAGKIVLISGSAIAHIEQGRMEVSRARIETLVAAYGYTMSDYMEFQDGKEIPRNLVATMTTGSVFMFLKPMLGESDTESKPEFLDTTSEGVQKNDSLNRAELHLLLSLDEIQKANDVVTTKLLNQNKKEVQFEQHDRISR